MRNPWSRIAWIRHGRSAELFVAGNSYRCPLALARLLAGHREIAGAALLQSGGTGWLPLLAELVNAGHWNIAALRPSSRGRTKLQ